jgi:acyl dehydratase
MQVFEGVADLEQAVGSHLGYSDWYTVSQDQITAFADVTEDRQWIHVDPARAASGPFGATVAHGFLTLSLIPRLSSEVYAVQGTRMIVNYGANKVRFPAPVTSGSRVRVGVEIIEVAPSSVGHLVTARMTTERESETKPAAIVDLLFLVVE